MMQNNSPFQPFIVRMNNDLSNWLQRQKQIKKLLQDYKNTQAYLKEDFALNNKLLVDHGQNIYSKAKTIDDKVVIRVKEGLYVEMTQKQGLKSVQSLIEFYGQKATMAQNQVSKIMTSMRQVQSLIQQYDSFPAA